MATPGEEADQAGKCSRSPPSVSEQGREGSLRCSPGQQHEPYLGCISVSVLYEAVAPPALSIGLSLQRDIRPESKGLSVLWA